MACVLIVDDNQLMAEMLSLVVGAGGHETVVAYSGSQALSLVAETRPDLILLDLMMPDMDGFETLRRIRSMPAGRDLPVIVVTASAEEHLEAHVFQAGGNGYLSKPVDSAALADLIRVHLTPPDALGGTGTYG